MPGCDAVFTHEPTAAERSERRRLELAGQREQRRRQHETRLEPERAAWRDRVAESKRRRELTPAQRAEEDQCEAEIQRVHDDLEAAFDAWGRAEQAGDLYEAARLEGVANGLEGVLQGLRMGWLR